MRSSFALFLMKNVIRFLNILYFLFYYYGATRERYKNVMVIFNIFLYLYYHIFYFLLYLKQKTTLIKQKTKRLKQKTKLNTIFLHLYKYIFIL